MAYPIEATACSGRSFEGSTMLWALRDVSSPADSPPPPEKSSGPSSPAPPQLLQFPVELQLR
ncbi:Hypothetical predicted protein [Pelobates cultripes]|uniref:Uncharacterized protein n=1 Tax=Pelobates cultripes TaxID=61616 RepID=A0AAD1WAE7_PELCU|nr:Hypothetical predicted protein [Pelobates cultripes]